MAGFSVIVPSYNRADLIGLTLDAVLAQDLPPREVIVADDGSTDDTRSVLAAYGGKIRVLHRANSGAAGARHDGVLASSGQFVAFCDSDDIWQPNHLSRLADLLTSGQCPFAFSNFRVIKEDRWQDGDKFAEAPSGYWSDLTRLDDRLALAPQPLFRHILDFQPIFPSCTAMSRAFYDLVGGYRQEFGRLPSEDLEFTLRCVAQAPTGLVLEPTVGVRKHAGNDSRDVRRQLSGEIEILDWSRHHHAVSREWGEAIDRQIERRAGQAFELAFSAADIGAARGFAARLPASGRSGKLRVKLAITGLPRPLAAPLAGLLAG